MELIELKANIRTSTGNGPARALRHRKQMPAILYGPKTESILLSVGIRDFEQALKRGRIGQILLNLVIQNGETFTRLVMIKELQVHPVSRNFLHIDFYEIAMDRKIRAKVPVVVKGKAKGVERGGMLQVLSRKIEVFCMPLKIPESIEIDVADLDIGDSIHVEEIPLKDDIEVSTGVNFTVLTVLSPKVEKEEEVEEEEEIEGVAAGEEAPEAGGN